MIDFNLIDCDRFDDECFIVVTHRMRIKTHCVLLCMLLSPSQRERERETKYF